MPLSTDSLAKALTLNKSPVFNYQAKAIHEKPYMDNYNLALVSFIGNHDT